MVSKATIKQDWSLKVNLQKGMNLIDKALVTGIMKLWIYPHLLLLQVGWLLMTYEIPNSWRENLEVPVNGYIKKWLGDRRCH